MSSPNEIKRNGFKWGVNEVLSLQREYELLGWDINKIANKHNRTPQAIMCKLTSEGIADYSDLMTKPHSFIRQIKLTNRGINPDMIDNINSIEDDDDDESVVSDVSENNYEFIDRLQSVESDICQIKKMLNLLVSSNKKGVSSNAQH